MQMGPRTRRVAAPLVLALVGASALVGAAPAATADGPEPVTITEEAGVLRLHVAANAATATFTPAGGGDVITQTFARNGQCAVTTSGPALLALTGNGAGPGLVGNNIGVRSANSCGLLSAAATVTGGELLTVGLGSHFDQADPDVRVAIARAELDVAAMYRAHLGLALDGGAATTQPLANNRGTALDAGVRDNNRVVVDAAALGSPTFRSITLGAVATTLPAPLAGISLNGGGDGTFARYQAAGLVSDLGAAHGTADSIFRVVTETQWSDSIECGDTEPSVAFGEGAATEATVTWTPPPVCEEGDGVAIEFENTPEGVILEKSYVNLTPAEIAALRFQVSITWAPTPASSPLPAREISLVPPFEESTFQPVAWCLGQDGTGAWIHPDATPWCLVSNDEVLNGDGTVTQTQVYDGAGDPMWR